MNRSEVLEYLGQQRLAVLATASREGAPEAAVIGIAVTDRFEVVFDTLSSTRKFQNLECNPRVALVIGWEHERTVQLEGEADLPQGDELERLKRAYLAAHPDGVERQSWPGLVYVRVRPGWLRYSDFNGKQPLIVEFLGEKLVTP